MSENKISNPFVLVEKDDNANVIIKCNGFVQVASIKTPDGDTEDTVFLCKTNDKLSNKSIDTYFDVCGINYSNDNDILNHSNDFIPLSNLFSLYHDSNNLYSITINETDNLLSVLDVDFGFEYGSTHEGYMWMNDEIKFGGHNLKSQIENMNFASITITIHSKEDIIRRFGNIKEMQLHLKSCGIWWDRAKRIVEHYGFSVNSGFDKLFSKHDNLYRISHKPYICECCKQEVYSKKVWFVCDGEYFVDEVDISGGVVGYTIYSNGEYVTRLDECKIAIEYFASPELAQTECDRRNEERNGQR